MQTNRSLLCSFLLSILVLSCKMVVHAQTISTIAGIGIAGYSGDGGPATSAKLWGPCRIVFDGAGNMYFTDGANSGVRKINTAGIITTFAGNGTPGFFGDGGPATAAELYNPTAIAIDGTGNIYICDVTNRRIRKVNTLGIISTIAGNGTYGYTGDGGMATDAEIKLPSGIVLDASGNIFIADNGCNVIRKINTAGIISTIAGTGIAGYGGDGMPATAALFNGPCYIAIDMAGNLFVPDVSNRRVRKIDAMGIISTVAGTGTMGYSGDGGPATAALLNQPSSIGIDDLGNLYIGDVVNNVIRKVNNSGIITTIAGTGVAGYSGDGGPATAARIKQPLVSVNCARNIYFTDGSNNVIRKIQYNHSPLFTLSHTQTLNVCASTINAPINALLPAADTDSLQTLNWSVAVSAMHGAVAGSYVAVSTGSTITPTGLSYTPAAGFVGADTFKIKVNDCDYFSDTMTICVTVSNCALGSSSISYSRVNDGIRIWPNPTNNELFIENSNNTSSTLSIVNTMGKQLTASGLYINPNDVLRIDVSFLPAGLYFLTLHGEQSNKVIKFLKL
jgi:Secretion system C-terminal sorting domain/Bacterial Ig domain